MITILRVSLIKPLDTTVQPAVCHLHGFFSISIFCIPRSTFVKCHHYICSDSTFNVHHFFRGKDMLTSVDMRTKLCAFFTQFSNTRQRKNLKAAAIGQHRTVEAIELMQSAGFFNHIQSRTQIKMIGVSQYNLRLYILFQLCQMHSFDGSQRTYRHKDRRFNLPMISRYQSCTCICLAVCIL